MNYLPKICTIFLCAALLFTIAACNQNVEEPEPKQEQSQEQEEEQKVFHTVSFITNSESSIKSQQVEDGNKAVKPANPVKENGENEAYTFENWYTSADNGKTLSATPFNFETAITFDIVLYAKWTVLALHEVSFNSNGGSPVTSMKVADGKKITKPANPTKEGSGEETWSFENWYTSEDEGLTLSDTPFNFNTALNSDITLYAKWVESIILLDCSDIRDIFEELCESESEESPKKIKHFAKAEKKPDSAEYYIDAAVNSIPLWYDEEAKTLYYYIEPGKKMSLRTSDNSNSLFYDMKDLISVETVDFNTSSVTVMTDMFGNCFNLKELDLSNFNTASVTDMTRMFESCYDLTSLNVSRFDTSSVTSMLYMFEGCSSLTELDLSGFNTSRVTTMAGMFESCYALKSLDLSNFDNSSVTEMNNMFLDCYALTNLKLDNFNTGSVTNMSRMFDSCRALKSLDLSSFNTSNVTNMGRMFFDCPLLTSLNLSSFNTGKVTMMGSMFEGCTSLTDLNVTSFNTGSLISMDAMFKTCSALKNLDLSSFNTSNVFTMTEMFCDCSSLTTVIVSDSFVTGSGSYDDMFKNCSSLKGGSGTVYDENHIQKEYARIDGGTDNPGYFTAKQ